MPLSAQQCCNRLWDGTSAIDESRTFAIVPLKDKERLLKSNAASIDLRLGRWFRSMRQSRVTEIPDDEDSKQAGISKEHYIRFDDHFVLHPGQFVIGMTLEWLRFPIDLAGYVVGKSSWGRRGLIIETAAGIHPGYTGCLTLELANVGVAPIKLRPGMHICQIFLHKVDESGGAAETQFVGFRKPRLGRLESDPILRALGRDYFE